MERIITLLSEKNHYLEKFYALNEAELVNFAAGDFENLESFYNTRERILDTLKYIDAQMDKAQQHLGEETTEEYRVTVRESLRIKDEYVSRIIEQDIQVLSCIELMKDSIIKELQEVKKGKKAVGGYKAKTFDQRLNEEV